VKGLQASIILAGAAMLAAVSGPAAAKSQKDESPFVEGPSSQDWEAALPAAARSLGRGGLAYMRCKVQPDRSLSDCKVIKETPPALGFGAALLGLAPKFRARNTDKPELVVMGDWYRADTPGDWLKKPSPENLLAVFPRGAFREGISGSARISCLATVQGVLTDCVVLDESPAGKGFGDAAVALTPQFLMKPARYKGEPVPSPVNIPINFKMEGRGEVFGSKSVAPAALPWAEAPSYADVAAAYPKAAAAQKKGGHVALDCDMKKDGRLDCREITAEPENLGFGAAAKKLSKQFRFTVSSKADEEATSRVSVQLPVTFDPEMLSGQPAAIGKPVWAKLPTADEQQAAFAKLDLKQPARAAMNCVVQPGGVLGDCAVTSEEPANSGLGAALLALTPKFRVTTWSAEGLPVVGARITVPMRYQP
jgi:TonB family protein